MLGAEARQGAFRHPISVSCIGDGIRTLERQGVLWLLNRRCDLRSPSGILRWQADPASARAELVYQGQFGAQTVDFLDGPNTWAALQGTVVGPRLNRSGFAGRFLQHNHRTPSSPSRRTSFAAMWPTWVFAHAGPGVVASPAKCSPCTVLCAPGTCQQVSNESMDVPVREFLPE